MKKGVVHKVFRLFATNKSGTELGTKRGLDAIKTKAWEEGSRKR